MGHVLDLLDQIRAARMVWEDARQSGRPDPDIRELGLQLDLLLGELLIERGDRVRTLGWFNGEHPHFRAKTLRGMRRRIEREVCKTVDPRSPEFALARDLALIKVAIERTATHYPIPYTDEEVAEVEARATDYARDLGVRLLGFRLTRPSEASPAERVDRRLVATTHLIGRIEQVTIEVEF